MSELSSNIYFAYLFFLFAGFVAGLIFARLFRSSTFSDKNTEEKSAYLKGINFILSRETDKAIEEFTKAVKIDSNTIDAYFTLGSLFRSKGDVVRATRIHQGITLRPLVDEKTKLRAVYELGLDFKAAGFVKRAIASFEEVLEKRPNMIDACEQLEVLYEDTKDWTSALQLQIKNSRFKKGKNKSVVAHIYTEIGKGCAEKGEKNDAQKAFKKAISLNPACVDAYLHLGDLYASQDDHEKAIKTWKKIIDVVPRFAHLAYSRLEESYFRLGQFDEMEVLLRDISLKNREDFHTHLSLARYLYKKNNVKEAVNELRAALDYNPNFIEARKELGRILLEQDLKEEVIEEFEKLLKQLPPQIKPYQCCICGYESESLVWKCPQCHKWDTINFKDVSKRKAAS